MGDLGIREVVVPLDGTVGAERALPVAEFLAAALGAEVHLLAVAPSAATGAALERSIERARHMVADHLGEARVAWSQYTWAGNAIDLDRRGTRVWLLAATGVMLAAAAALPTAFDDDGGWFAIPYTTVRLIGLALYWTGLRGEPEHRAALRTYVPIALISPALVLAGGFAGPGVRPLLWIAAVAVDVASVAAAGRGEFRVEAGHFAERHGLIVIIALGESVIAIGATAADVGLSRDVATLVAVAFAAVAGLWWCYFDWVHAAAEARLLREPDHRRRSNLARDLFTLGHLPIVAGTVVFAAAIEEALLHPADDLEPFAVTALAIGPGLYLAGFVAGNLRATGHLLPTRTVGLVAITAVALLAGSALDALPAIGLVTAGIVAVAAVETVQRAGPPGTGTTHP